MADYAVKQLINKDRDLEESLSAFGWTPAQVQNLCAWLHNHPDWYPAVLGVDRVLISDERGNVIYGFGRWQE